MKIAMTTFGLLTLILTGCGSSAQLVRKDTAGGVVALRGAFMPAMGEARMMMFEYCDGRFDAVEQGEQVSFRCREAGEGHNPTLAGLDEGTRGAP